MTSAQDKFWRLFFIGLAVLLVLVGISLLEVLSRLSLPIEEVSLDTIEEPFVYARADEDPPRLPSVPVAPVNYFYRDSVPAGLYDTSWGVDIAWQATERVYEGTYAARVAFKDPWSGVGISGDFADLTAYKSITLAVFIESGVSELYLELYNSNNGVVGRKALSQYSPNGQLTAGSWQHVIVPVASFMPVLPKNTVGLAIVSEAPGIVFLDDIRLLP